MRAVLIRLFNTTAKLQLDDGRRFSTGRACAGHLQLRIIIGHEAAILCAGKTTSLRWMRSGGDSSMVNVRGNNNKGFAIRGEDPLSANLRDPR